MLLFALSPAKSLDYDSPIPEAPHSRPHFVAQAHELVQLLRQRSPQQLAELMGISDTLAALNVARFAAWSTRFSARNARQAVLAFDGDVYDGLAARSLGAEELQWLDQHLCILSGLYGVLRPLDWMQPYRLEMGTRLPNARGKDLYRYWRDDIVAYLNRRLHGVAEPVLVNLASQEYFKAVDTRALRARVVECVFEEYRGGRHQIISFMAKRARGLMMRHAVERRATRVEQLRDFNAEGYALDAQASSADRLVFRRAG